MNQQHGGATNRYNVVVSNLSFTTKQYSRAHNDAKTFILGNYVHINILYLQIARLFFIHITFQYLMFENKSENTLVESFSSQYVCCCRHTTHFMMERQLYI